MLKFDDRFPTFENYLYNVHSQLINKWIEHIKDVPDGTPLDSIPGAEELRNDVTRFEYFCRKYFGYDQYPKGHPEQYQFYYMGDMEKPSNATTHYASYTIVENTSDDCDK